MKLSAITLAVTVVLAFSVQLAFAQEKKDSPADAKPPAQAGLAGRYAFRMAGPAGAETCEQIDVGEDIEIREGGPQNVSGRDFNNLRFQSAQGGSVTATVQGIQTRWGGGDAKLAGSATATGFAGTFEWRSGPWVCQGKWTLVRKGN